MRSVRAAFSTVALLLLGSGIVAAANSAHSIKQAMDTLQRECAKLGKPRVVAASDAAGTPQLYFGDHAVQGAEDFVDAVQKATGAATTLFVRSGAEFVRVATTIRKPDGSPAVGTALAHNDAYAALSRGSAYQGPIDVLGVSYDTSYEPIVDATGKTVGVYFVGFPVSGQASSGIAAANDAFYAALNRMFAGDIAPMKALWSHAADVTYMGPTGQYETGWDAVARDWDYQASLKLGGTVRPGNVQTVATERLAVVTNYEEGENTNADGKVSKLRLRATNVYRLEDGQWKMVHHHTDTLPYLDK